MKLSSISEATTNWVGPIDSQLGDGSNESLNYGTADPSRPPFLFIPIPLSRIRTGINYLSRNKVAYYIPGKGGEVLSGTAESLKSSIPEGSIIIENPGRVMTHIGEAHITLSMGAELQNAMKNIDLRQVTVGNEQLFNGKNGVKTPVTYTGKFRVMQAKFYEDESDVGGPILIAEEVKIPMLGPIRRALGLSELPTIPGGQVYIPHITYGYIAKKNLIHSTYTSKHGSNPRQLSKRS